MLKVSHASVAMNLRLLLCVLGLLGLCVPAARAQIAAVASPSGPVMAGPYVVVDAATGETLLERDAGALWYPASLALKGRRGLWEPIDWLVPLTALSFVLLMLFAPPASRLWPHDASR